MNKNKITPVVFEKSSIPEEGSKELPKYEDGEYMVTKWKITPFQALKIIFNKGFYITTKAIEQPQITVTIDTTVE